MSLFLHLRCGDSGLLLDIDCVEEVGLASADRDDGQGLRRWREGMLPFFQLGTVLGFSGKGEHQLVINDDGQRCIIEVDAVLDLRPVTVGEWRRFSAVTPQASRFFDAALPLEDGRCLLRLRRPLAWLQCTPASPADALAADAQA